MAFALSNYAADKMLNCLLRGQTFTAPPKVYIALYTSNPTAADTGTEVVGGGYARMEVNFSAPTTETAQIYHPINGQLTTVQRRTVRNSGEVASPVATDNWGTITHVGIRDAVTNGNLLIFGAVDNPRSILVNDVLKWFAASIASSLN